MKVWVIIIIKDHWNTTLFCICLIPKVNASSSIALFQLCNIIWRKDVLRNHFIPAVIGESLISEHLRQCITLPIRLDGMAVTTPHFNTEAEYNAPSFLTGDIVYHIINQKAEYKPNRERTSEIKTISTWKNRSWKYQPKQN